MKTKKEVEREKQKIKAIQKQWREKEAK